MNREKIGTIGHIDHGKTTLTAAKSISDILKEYIQPFDSEAHVDQFVSYDSASPVDMFLCSRVPQYRRGSPKIGRNSKCPCRSGKKHKYCCI